LAPREAGKTLLLAPWPAASAASRRIHLQGRRRRRVGSARWRRWWLYLTQRPVPWGNGGGELRSPWSFQERTRAGGLAARADHGLVAPWGGESNRSGYERRALSAASLALLALPCGPCKLDPSWLLLG